MFQRTFLTGLAVTLLVVQACGSDDGKKATRTVPEGGMGGEAGGGGSPDHGGSSAGTPAAGQAPIPVGGFGGGGGETPIPEAGAGGVPVVIVPQPELLFTVKPGANGLLDTALDAAHQGNPENHIYSSNTGSQDARNGTNAVKIFGISLGLDADDQIVAFALPQPEPQNPTFLFSIADGTEGAYGTRAYLEYSTDSGNEEGDVYFSDGVESLRYPGESGDQLGYNGLLASEQSLGLARGNGSEPDDLTGLAVHDANHAITELYFTVSPAAFGGEDSVLSGLAAAERGCTVFKSELDDAHSVAFTCAELGLLPGDQIDALAIFASAGAADVVFSVTNGAQGAVGSPVETARLAQLGRGSVLYRSSGDDAHTVFKASRELGLAEFNYSDDELDGLAIIDQAKASVAPGVSCQLTYDPLGTGAGAGELTSITGTSRVGNNVLVVFGNTATSPRLIAYNASTCGFLQQRDMPTGFDNAEALAIVPLTGWSGAKPLDKVEYLRVAPRGYGKEIQRYDAAGTFDTAFLVSNTESTDTARALIHEPGSDQLYMVLVPTSSASQASFAVLPRPNGTNTLQAVFAELTVPCSNDAALTGVDAAGNLYVARSQSNETDYRVCAFRPDGELLPAPYGWGSNTAGFSGGFIVPGGSHFLLHTGGSPMTIERGVYSAP